MAKRAKSKKPNTITFDYIKSQSFRVIHVDGVHGGITPDGKRLHVSLFNERGPIPLQQTHEISKTGELGEKITNEKRETDVIREVESTLLLDFDTAKAIRNWLDNYLAIADDLKNKEDREIKQR